MTKDELRQRCAWVSARIAKTAFEQGSFDPTFYFSKGDEPMMRELVLHALAALMNDGRGKEQFFSYIRWMTERNGYNCVIQATDTYLTASEPSFMELSEEQREILMTDPEAMATLGYATRSEAIVVLGQTPSMALTISTRYERNPKNPEKIQSLLEPQEYFLEAGDRLEGRAAIWGPTGEPGMPDTYARLKQHLDALDSEQQDELNLASRAPLVDMAS